MMNLPVLTNLELGAEFHAMPAAIAELLPVPEYSSIPVQLDGLPSPSARLDLVRLAVIVALERTAKGVQVVPAADQHRNSLGHDWVISWEERQSERTVVITEHEDEVVRVNVNGTPIDVQPPSEQDCRRLLGSGVRGTAMRFPVFPSSGPSMVARGDGPDELVLWRCGLPAARFRMPGPVLAATHVPDPYLESLTALIEVDGELVVHSVGDQNSDVHKLRAPIDFSVAEEAERDLSPLYLHLVEAWDDGVYFRRAGQWWNLRRYGGHVTLQPSLDRPHGPETHPFHTRLDGTSSAIYGPDRSHTGAHSPVRKNGQWWENWKIWGTDGDNPQFIPVPPGEDVLSLTKIDDEPALLTREGDLVQVRTKQGARPVVEFAGPLVLHHHLPWVAVQRSAHEIEVLDVATGAVLHRLSTWPQVLSQTRGSDL